MGFFKFIKKVLDTAKEIDEEIVIAKVKSDDINSWIHNQKKALAEEESKFLKQITERVLLLADELETEVTALQEVNFDDIKTEKRAKMIVGTNLDLYIGHLTKLIVTLRELNITTTHNLLENITMIFRNFEQKSMKNFQKAAFLVGHKLGDIGVSTGKFFKDIRQQIKDNNSLINRAKIIHAVDLELNEIDNFEKTKLEFKSNIDAFEQNITKLESKKKGIDEEIESIKKSKSYAKETNEREEFEKDKTELTKSIYELRKLIDFKLLSNTFHSNHKHLAIVRNYKANFEEAFQRDSGKKLIILLEEAKINQSNILDSIKKITKTQQKIENTVIESDKIENLNKDITNITHQIEDLNSKKEIEQKKHNKFQTSKDKIWDIIKSKLSKINVELE
jgi:hypothetical protein